MSHNISLKGCGPALKSYPRCSVMVCKLLKPLSYLQKMGSTFVETCRLRWEAKGPTWEGKWSHLLTVIPLKPVHHFSLPMIALGTLLNPTIDRDRTRVAVLFCKGRDWAGTWGQPMPSLAFGVAVAVMLSQKHILSPHTGGQEGRKVFRLPAKECAHLLESFSSFYHVDPIGHNL